MLTAAQMVHGSRNIRFILSFSLLIIDSGEFGIEKNDDIKIKALVHRRADRQGTNKLRGATLI
jgi:hypothetical protein